jgi:hypothetical protein
MFWASTLFDTADNQPIIHFRPYPLQHVTIDLFYIGTELQAIGFVIIG